MQLKLLRGFELRADDEAADLPTNVQRLLAFLAVRGQAQHRMTVAGTLWTDRTEDRAAASLRTALWQARRIDRQLVTTRGSYLALGPEVLIDVTDAVEQSRRLALDPSGLRRDRSGARPTSAWMTSCPSGTTTGCCSSGSGCARSTSTAWRRSVAAV